MAHLIADVGRGFALGDQLAGEEVSQVALSQLRLVGIW